MTSIGMNKTCIFSLLYPLLIVEKEDEKFFCFSVLDNFCLWGNFYYVENEWFKFLFWKTCVIVENFFLENLVNLKKYCSFANDLLTLMAD